MNVAVDPSPEIEKGLTAAGFPIRKGVAATSDKITPLDAENVVNLILGNAFV